MEEGVWGGSLKKSGEMESAQGRKRTSRIKQEPKPEAPPVSELAEAKAGREAAEKLSAQLHSKIQDLSERVASLEGQLQERGRELEAAKAIQATLAAATSDLAREKAARAAAEDQAQVVQTRLTQARSDLAQATSARDAASQELTLLTSKVQELGSKLEESGREAAKIRDELKGTRSKEALFGTLSSDLAREKAARLALESDSKATQARFDQAASELAQAKSARDASAQDLARLTARVQELAAQAEQSTRETARLNAELKDAQARESQMGALSSDLAREKSARAAAEAKTQAVQARLDQTAWDQAQAGTARESASKELEILTARVQELTVQAQQSARETAQLQTELKEAKPKAAQVGSMALELTKIRTARDDSEKKAAALETRLQELGLRTAETDVEISRLKEEAAKAQGQVAGLERRVLELSSEAACAASLERELLALGQEVEESRRRLEAAQADHAREIESARRELAELRESEGKARSQAQELTSLRATLEARAAERARECDSLRREMSELRESEGKARAQAQELAPLRSTLETRTAELRRLEALRKSQEAKLEELRRSVAELERKAAPPGSAPESAPAEAPAAPVPAAPSPAVEAEARPPAPVETPLPVAETAPEPPPAPFLVPQPAPAGSTAIRVRKLNPAEAAQDPRNLFGPTAEDGRPAYVLLEQVSVDALGVVYRACERTSDRRFAVRFMSGQAGEEQTAAIEQEVQLLIALPHPNILQVQGSGRRQNRLYIAMDLVEAPTLARARIQEIPRICHILRDAAEAVHYAHEEGILHGDLCPENILVGREEDRDHGYVKDFGLGHLLEGMSPAAGGKQASPQIRNPGCLAPEQLKEMKGKLSVAADVYGLGATLYSALAGRPPFEGPDARQVLMRAAIEEPPPVERFRRDTPEALGAIVRRAMAKERTLRYPSAGEMVQALTRFLERPTTAIRAKPASPEESRP